MTGRPVERETGERGAASDGIPGGWPAPVDHEVHPLVRSRWSPREFADRPVPGEVLASLFEAARWAPSSFNDQPWRYVLGRRNEGDDFRAMAELLSDGNAWARQAPVLVLSVARTRFRRNDRPNRHAWHDVGAATENLFLEAFHRGLVMHEMAGFDREGARRWLELPDPFDPVAMIAIGYPAPGTVERARAEGRSRKRLPLAELVFEGGWDEPAEL